MSSALVEWTSVFNFMPVPRSTIRITMHDGKLFLFGNWTFCSLCFQEKLTHEELAGRYFCLDLRWCYTGATPTCNDMMLREKSFKCKHPVADDFLRYLQCCNALQGFESDSKVRRVCKFVRKTCVANRRCKLALQVDQCNTTFTSSLPLCTCLFLSRPREKKRETGWRWWQREEPGKNCPHILKRLCHFPYSNLAQIYSVYDLLLSSSALMTEKRLWVFLKMRSLLIVALCNTCRTL